MITVEVKKMSTIERFQTMEAIWDSLLYEDVEIESPEWHRDILAERKMENGNAEYISIKKLNGGHFQ